MCIRTAILTVVLCIGGAGVSPADELPSFEDVEVGSHRSESRRELSSGRGEGQLIVHSDILGGIDLRGSQVYDRAFAYDLHLSLSDGGRGGLSSVKAVTFVCFDSIASARTLPMDQDFIEEDPVQGHIDHDFDRIRPWGKRYSLAEAAANQGIECHRATRRESGEHCVTIPVTGGHALFLFAEVEELSGRRHVLVNGRTSGCIDVVSLLTGGCDAFLRVRFDHDDAPGFVGTLGGVVEGRERWQELRRVRLELVGSSAPLRSADVERVEWLTDWANCSPLRTLQDSEEILKGTFELPLPAPWKIGHSFKTFLAVVFRDGGVRTYEFFVYRRMRLSGNEPMVERTVTGSAFGRDDRQSLRHWAERP